MTSSIDRTSQQFLTITDLDLITKFDFYLIVQGFHRTYATDAACQQRTLTPPDTWSCPTLGLAWVLMSRPISPELVLFPDFWISNIPRYFSFAPNRYQTDVLNCRLATFHVPVLHMLSEIDPPYCLEITFLIGTRLMCLTVDWLCSMCLFFTCLVK